MDYLVAKLVSEKLDGLSQVTFRMCSKDCRDAVNVDKKVVRNAAMRELVSVFDKALKIKYVINGQGSIPFRNYPLSLKSGYGNEHVIRIPYPYPDGYKHPLPKEWGLTFSLPDDVSEDIMDLLKVNPLEESPIICVKTHMDSLSPKARVEVLKYFKRINREFVVKYWTALLDQERFTSTESKKRAWTQRAKMILELLRGVTGVTPLTFWMNTFM